jgi:hypothetical protein
MVELIIIDGNPSHLNEKYLEKFGNGKIFVETGTYLGDTVKLALEFGYEMVHSVELDAGLYERAVEMFKDNPKVKIWQGDSAEQLANIINEIGDQPATFWLDAHASGHLVGGKSGGTPVVDELKAIAASPCKNHTIFIDDRRLFGCAEWSYVTEAQAYEEIMKINPAYLVVALDGHQAADVICATTRTVE